ncbi:proteolipid protein 2 [Ambystoma mexicanum]|uniref:proteolipid protein 2 n=1 Tax=Ambystoma mexicanum TaxID=8296 RepID=UPI0037E71DE1
MSDTGDRGESSPGFIGGFTSYLRTLKGMILAMETVLCIVILICYGASRYAGYTTLPIVEMILCIIFFVIFMLKLDKSITFIHWPVTDLIRAAIAALCFLITSLIRVIGSHGDGAAIAAGVFGILAGVLFGYDCYTIFITLRRAHAPAATSSPDADGV